ncbi:hypothetical protein Bca52824_057927 [Brassica carinata]|uniref:Pentatricopeptide repeat-containing protein n=1 Tax=Brassica carinata TaxID=52824 RepID=A0A8X7UE35_BRACI|nr:hypothetical protein Bca52824_057927 [Brassica carinata]
MSLFLSDSSSPKFVPVSYFREARTGCGKLVLANFGEGGDISSARQVFDERPEKQYVALWMAMTAGYTENEKALQATDLFRRMEEERVKLDESIVTVVLSPCVDLGVVQMGERMYSRITKSKKK